MLIPYFEHFYKIKTVWEWWVLFLFYYVFYTYHTFICASNLHFPSIIWVMRIYWSLFIIYVRPLVFVNNRKIIIDAFFSYFRKISPQNKRLFGTNIVMRRDENIPITDSEKIICMVLSTFPWISSNSITGVYVWYSANRYHTYLQ